LSTKTGSFRIHKLVQKPGLQSPVIRLWVYDARQGHGNTAKSRRQTSASRCAACSDALVTLDVAGVLQHNHKVVVGVDVEGMNA